MSSHHELECDSGGERLDSYIARRMPELSRSRIQKLIEAKQVSVNGKECRASLLLNIGDKICIAIPPPRSHHLVAEEIPLDILYEDDSILVLNKRAGLVVHPAHGNWEGTLVQALLHHCGKKLPVIGGEERPGIVHRIDKQTSGILVIAKDDHAHQSLSQQFKVHSIERSYIGLSWGTIPEQGSFEDSIARDPRERKRMWIDPKGKTALTKFKREKLLSLGQDSALSLFKAELLTGRTHQIRVHFAAHGFALIGDGVYNGASRSSRQKKEIGLRYLQKKNPKLKEAIEELYQNSRQFLHASFLSFNHPVNQKRLAFASSLPQELSAIIELW